MTSDDDRIALVASEIQSLLRGMPITIAMPALMTNVCLAGHGAGFSKENIIDLFTQAHEELTAAIKAQGN